MILKLLSYVGILSAFVFLTMAIASVLYYLSEQVEEYTVFTKRLLTRLIYAIMVVHLLLIFDGFPFKLTMFSIAAHFVYLQNLNKFPFINLTSGTFITSCIMVVINHWLWFNHFSDSSLPPASILRDRPHYAGKTHPPFSQVASFFGLCVWLIPFALFISLSAGDNVLPLTSDIQEQDETGAQKARRRSAGLAKVVVEKLWIYIAEVGKYFGYDIDPGHGQLLS